MNYDSSESLISVSPSLDSDIKETVFGDLWERPYLSKRDRSIITLAVLIGRNQMADYPFYLNYALDHGVSPSEISAIINHMAFYSGLGNATGATTLTKKVFQQRDIHFDVTAQSSSHRLPIDENAEKHRAELVEQSVGSVSPGLVEFTGKTLFRDLWLRPDLAPRDRSIITVAGLIASGQVAQIPFHLNKAMDNGLTRAQAGELLTQAAFYAGWPNAFSAVPVFKEVFEKRETSVTH
ncbi:TPA: 4-carboxymuconolactone decarboxylase [Enterobacter hormaechei subsp. steigerwaltii]|nr:4-carboxymuconolactone decarboxylase [Enterobacter hormaechei subsp. steigerwaltii]